MLETSAAARYTNNAAVIALDPAPVQRREALLKWTRNSQKEQPMARPQRSEKSLLNRAYGCFAFLGMATLPVGVGFLLSALHWMNFDEGSNGGTLSMLFGMVLATPLAIGMVAASIFGIKHTVRFRHPALIVLALVSIICGGGLIVLLPLTPAWNGGPDSPIIDYVMSVAFGIYIVANLLIPGWWFFKGRRHYKSSPALGS